MSFEKLGSLLSHCKDCTVLVGRRMRESLSGADDGAELKVVKWVPSSHEFGAVSNLEVISSMKP